MAYRKKTYKYICLRCGKKKQSVDNARKTCQACEAWAKPGIGQTDIFGETVKQ